MASTTAATPRRRSPFAPATADAAGTKGQWLWDCFASKALCPVATRTTPIAAPRGFIAALAWRALRGFKLRRMSSIPLATASTAQHAAVVGAAPLTGLAPALDMPLPDAIAGRDHGWLTAYRRWPVFSPAWALGRARRLAVVIVIGTTLAFGAVVLSAPITPPWGALVQIALGVLVPLFAGPWLGSRVRRQGWPPRREWAALVAVVMALVLGVAAFNEWGAEPVKQQLAEWTGAVDANGQRKRVALIFGVSIKAPPTAASAAVAASASASATGAASGSARANAPGDDDASDQMPGPRPGLATQLMFALISFSLAGGWALPRWGRERNGLLALAHEEELARAQAQARESELRLSVLAAQVEPHFLFNTLAGVRSAITTDPERASEMIDHLADYLRGAIPRLRSDGTVAASTLGAQADFVRAYLQLMRSRMPRLSFAIEVPHALRDAPCPPLMLISLAENAVRHGVEPKVGPVFVRLSAQRTAAGLEVTVADDGAGFGHSPAGSGIGLANIRARLAQMQGTRAALELRARTEGGVAATLLLPWDGVHA